MKKNKILIVEEYDGFLQLFRRLLQNVPEIEIVWEAKSSLEALLALEFFKPDIIVMNPAPTWRQGVKTWKQFKIQAPECKQLILTLPQNSSQLKQVKALGVTCLAKEEMVRFLIPTMRRLVASSQPAAPIR